MGNIIVFDLRCEYLQNPLGIDEIKPRLSWKLKSNDNNLYQTSYQIFVASSKEDLNESKSNLWNTGKIDSDQTVNIEYKGKKLKSYQYCYWKIKVWWSKGVGAESDKSNVTDKSSESSELAFWSMGILNKEDWKAEWIGEIPKDPKKILPENPKGSDWHFDDVPSPILRKNFVLKNKILRATMFVSSLGEYIAYINGKRVGDHILAPEWTDYSARVQYQAYDVAALLKKGYENKNQNENVNKNENVVGVVLGDGWYIGFLGPGDRNFHGNYGVDRRLILQLLIEYENGEKEFITSGPDWKVSKGPIINSDHFLGEKYDFNKEQIGWNSTNFNAQDWKQAYVDKEINKNLVAQMNEPIRAFEYIKPIDVKEPNSGTFIVNMGQNMVGWCKISLPEGSFEKNSTIRIRHGEMVELDGTLYTDNLRHADATDYYILSDRDNYILEPHFTYHGFQYIEITGLKKGFKILKENLSEIVLGVAFSSDPEVVGNFESSNESLNKLFSNILWTQRDNMISIPTDCPQRCERMGWMGDAQVFAQTSIFNMNMAAFYTKWLKDIRDAQDTEGRFPCYIPYPHGREVVNTPAWADAGNTIPWDIYLNYGDLRVIENHYAASKRNVDFIYKHNPKLIWKKETGHNFNDWLNGNTIKSANYPKKGGSIPRPVFATAFFAHSVDLVSKMAKLLGKTEDAINYSNLFNEIKKAFNKKFVKRTGIIKGETQAGYALSLNFGMIDIDNIDEVVTSKLKNKINSRLVNAIDKYDGRISTGFCTTLRMMMELSKGGNNEVAYKLLLSRRFPSWFYMIDQGATTMWERWDAFVAGRGFQNKGMNSFNHYSIGSVGEWLYRNVLGINFDENEPGYKHIIIKPLPGDGIDWVKGHYNSIRGKIAMGWKINGDQVNYDVEIPVNSKATVILPTSDIGSIKCEQLSIDELKIESIIQHEKLFAKFIIPSGKYTFITIN